MLRPLFAIVIVLLISTGLAWAGNYNSISANGNSLFLMATVLPFVLHWAAFIPAFTFQTEHYFDLTGATSYIAAVAIVLFNHPSPDARVILLLVMIAVWALRLGSFLFLRVKRAGSDRRFEDLKPHFFRFLFTWTLGGAWVFITMIAGLAASTSATQQPLGIAGVVGLILWIVGFSIEVIADAQKTRFRAQPENKDRFISTGLWGRSRHPNYFGEIVLWSGVAVVALPVLSGWSYFALISPLFVFVLLTRISGIPMLEKSADKRWGDDPDYQHYKEQTPVLIPRL
jgi:steroid 5-alpha reductase family enzyme